MIRIFVFCATLLLFMSEVILERKGKLIDFNFFQYDYNVTTEWFEIVRYNKDYINKYKISTFKYNRSTTALNITLNVKFDMSNLEMIVQAYKFLSNEYRSFPMRFEVNFCKSLKDNMIGSGRSSCGNFTGCPLLKETTYYLCNWTPDKSKFPPHVPNGRYMLEVQGVYFSTEVGVIRGYFAITRPEV